MAEKEKETTADIPQKEVITQVSDNMKKTANAIKDKTLKQNALDLLEQMDEVIEGIGDRPVTWNPSFLKLVQQTSDVDNLPEGAVPGKLILDEEVLDSLQFYPLRTWHSRTMWPEELESDQKICESPDAKYGWRYGNCQKCEFSQWDEEGGREGKGSVPCTKNVQVLGITPDLKHVMIISFYKTQYSAGRGLEKLMRSAKTHIYKRLYNLDVIKNAKNKNIFNMDPGFVPRADYELTDDVKDFLSEFFLKASENRRTQLQLFYESLEQRETQPQLGYDENTQAGTITIEYDKDGAADTDANADDGEDGSPTYKV